MTRNILIILLFFSTRCFSQEREANLLGIDQNWFEGTVTLTDGKQLQGLVRYNDRTAVLSYQNGDESRSFTPRSVLGFEFFDEQQQRQRVYYSIPYKTVEKNLNAADMMPKKRKPFNQEDQPGRKYFFELVRDYGSFVIISKVDPIEVEQKKSAGFANNDTRNSPGFNDVPGAFVKVEVSQEETIYLMNQKGEIEPYLRATSTEDGATNIFTNQDTKHSQKLVADEDLLAEYISEKSYKQLREYASQNKLRFRKKEDFLKILTYYDQIRASGN
jgi:hypothetical protein